MVTVKAIKIFKKKDMVYDVWDQTENKWLFSDVAPDNVFSRLSTLDFPFTIIFVDETIPNQKEML